MSQQIYSLPPLATWVSYHAGWGAEYAANPGALSNSGYSPCLDFCRPLFSPFFTRKGLFLLHEVAGLAFRAKLFQEDPGLDRICPTLGARLACDMVKKQQLEMSFGNSVACRSASVGRGRRARAQWWFNQMRLVVERADEWAGSANPPSPSADFGGGRRR